MNRFSGTFEIFRWGP